MSGNAPSRGEDGIPDASSREGISLNAFLGALSVSFIIFAVQITVFLLLRNKLARIFKPKTYLAPERERTDPPPRNPVALVKALWRFSDRDVLNKCGLDAYFFLRYLRTLLVIFIPITCVTFPILIPLNYVSGVNQDVVDSGNSTNSGPSGLDTLAWGNIAPVNHNRRWAHLIIAIGVICWVCTVVYLELRVYVKIRQDHLTSAVHRLRASATTVLINNIPQKWLTDEALRGLFDVFPGGIRNVWINRDLSKLLEKVEERDSVHKQLEAAETDLIKMAKKKQLKMKNKEEKAARKASNKKALTKEELQQRRAQEDAAAQRRAQEGQGFSAGVHDEIPHDASQVLDEAQDEELEKQASRSEQQASAGEGRRGFGFGVLGGGLQKVGHGLRGGVGRLERGVEDTVGTTNGFTRIESPVTQDQQHFPRGSTDHSRRQALRDPSSRPGTSQSARLHPGGHSRDASVMSHDSSQAGKAHADVAANGNTVRHVSDLNKMYDNEKRRWYQFWRPPAGGYASPVPQKTEGSEFPFDDQDEPPKSLWKQFLSIFGFGDDLPPIDYEQATYTGKDYDGDTKGEADAAWKKYLKPKNRPTHRLPRWGFPKWLAWLTFGKKVDTIYWCRGELARLNLEIRTDQAHPERYPLMNSAFIQFNEQASAHMACQSLIHHLPKQMAPRVNEVSPKDVIWSNMAIKWWDEWLRTGLVVGSIVVMVIFWTIPVAATATIANIDSLTQDVDWLRWIRDNKSVYEIAGVISGVLPPILLALLLVLVPIILDFFADFKGAKTGAQKTEFVQRFFFVFLFVQVFLVVSVSSFFAASFDEIWGKLEEVSNVEEVLDILARNLPKAANYFFSYMILQSLSASSGALLQILTLLTWYIFAKILDSTARNKWERNTRLNSIKWGHLFPVYTNFACIALIYSVIAPLISIFALITFSLLWFAQKYCLVYVIRTGTDTGGVLYPRALNQTFTGLYVMELCLAGLFLIDAQVDEASSTRAVISLITIPLTGLFQSLLNKTFSPLFRYLPVTIEDEAAIRDRAFEQEQKRRFGLAEDDADLGEPDALEDTEKPLAGLGADGQGSSTGNEVEDIELQGMASQKRPAKKAGFNPFSPVKDVTSLAKRGGKGLLNITDKVEAPAAMRNAAEFRKRQRNKDLEAQRAIGDALYGGVADEIEDLMPEERNALVMESFKHRALRARQPAVWIPRDDIGISDDEIRLTKEYTENIHISNEGTALDSKIRVVYGRNPPDFSEVDLIDL